MPDYAGQLERQNQLSNDRFQQEQRLQNIENKQRQQDWDQSNAYYRMLRDGNDMYGKGK
jgi:hypothetical protein